jgi:hypothetical protein
MLLYLPYYCNHYSVKYQLVIDLRAGPSGHAVEGIGLSCLFIGITGSNPTRGMDVYLCVSVLCCPV